MITQFNIVQDILHAKTGKLTDEFEFYSVFNPYLTQRWLSMDTKETASLVNETTNKLWKGLDNDKEMWYQLLLTMINKKKYKKIQYIKKPEKTINEKKEKEIEELAKQHNLSRKTIEQYIELLEYMKE